MGKYDVEHFNTVSHRWVWDASFRTREEAVEWAKKVYINTDWRVTTVMIVAEV